MVIWWWWLITCQIAIKVRIGSPLTKFCKLKSVDFFNTLLINKLNSGHLGIDMASSLNTEIQKIKTFSFNNNRHQVSYSFIFWKAKTVRMN